MAVASRRLSLPRGGTLSARGPLGGALLLGGLIAVSLFLRTRALDAPFWIDEGLSIGIASRPWYEIPAVLGQDGSPPAYYLLLHGWMAIVGAGQMETHWLSILIALVTIPVALWAGWSLFGRRAGWICAALAALNPFLTAYSQETRMYALVVLLSFLAGAAFLHAFVYRRRRYLPVFALALALMLYTHNWGLFFTVGALAALIPCFQGTDDRRGLAIDSALAFGGAALLFAPWVPTLLYQVFHTGAPWVNPPRVGAPIGAARQLLGGDRAVVAILLGGGVGIAGLLQHQARRNPERVAAIALFVLPAVTLAVAWVLSQLSPAWTPRYFGAVLGPAVLLVALGLARAGKLGLVALALILVFWAIPRTEILQNKSNAADVAQQVRGLLAPGDLVVSTQPEQVPLLRYFLPKQVRYATPLGPVADPRVMDWRDGMDRLREARPETTLEPLLATLPPGGHVLLVRPNTVNTEMWDAPWTQLIRRRSAQWGRALELDRRFRRTALAPRFFGGATRSGVRAVLYTKVTQ